MFVAECLLCLYRKSKRRLPWTSGFQGRCDQVWSHSFSDFAIGGAKPPPRFQLLHHGIMRRDGDKTRPENRCSDNRLGRDKQGVVASKLVMLVSREWQWNVIRENWTPADEGGKKLATALQSIYDFGRRWQGLSASKLYKTCETR